jgi:hypothetical protein
VGKPPLTDTVEVPLVPRHRQPDIASRSPQSHRLAACEDELDVPDALPYGDHRLHLRPGNAPPANSANDRGLARQDNATRADTEGHGNPCASGDQIEHAEQ